MKVRARFHSSASKTFSAARSRVRVDVTILKHNSVFGTLLLLLVSNNDNDNYNDDNNDDNNNNNDDNDNDNDDDDDDDT